MTSEVQQTRSGDAPLASEMQLADFWDLRPVERKTILSEAIQRSHAWHFERNQAYRQTVSARGVGPRAEPEDFARLLRPTAQTFKSYIELLGSPFPQHNPQPFLEWMADQLSIDLPRQRFKDFRKQYPSLEALLADFERVYADYGLEILTSSGTSGRATIMVRDNEALDKTVESFYLAFQRYMGMRAEHRAIFIMPQETRIAMARMAAFSFKRVGLPPERVHYTIPFPAHPDQVRIRAGRTFQPGWRGLIERRVMHPFMGWANERLVTPKAIRSTIEFLELAESEGDKVLLFTGWVQLHGVALALLEAGRKMRLAPGSLLGTGGGFKELYPYNAAQIRADLMKTFQINDGSPIPLRDTYGMAEGNWAAMQCAEGNYHIPPWVYAVSVDENDRLQPVPQSSGLLAFFDPFGGGRLFPAFFRTADRMELVNGALAYDPALDCPCGEAGAYVTQGSIQRVDLIDEAGCAAQV